MFNPPKRRLARGALVLASSTALAFTMTSAAWAADSPNQDEHGSSVQEQLQRLQDLKISGPLKDAQGETSAYVQFSGEGAFARTQSASVRHGKAKPAKKVAEVKAFRKSVDAKADSAARSADAKVLYKTSNTIPGVALRGDARQLRKLAQRSDVVKITKIVPKHLDNKGTDIDTGALQAWTAQHQTGKGVTIAVLDSGLDYTHADFGGPGTKEAYEKAQKMTNLPSPKDKLYDPKKFIGGWDLVGDDYNAKPSDPNYQPIPHPDANPLDCTSGGHGTHVAGTAAGYGVKANGKTFKGDFSSLTQKTVEAMRIGPGSAPEASLVSIRVFGCSGSSDVVGQALDYVLDPNGDGDFSDRAQIVNMSLGSDDSPADDPENDIVDALTEQGILSVIASGNNGDITDTGGSPGNSRSSLTVANSVGSTAAADVTTVTAPSNLAGDYASQLSANFPWTKVETGDVVVPKAGPKTTGCSALNSAEVKGKWVWLHWTDDPTGETFPCGSAVRFDNAAAAGASGVVLDSPVDVFTAGIAGNTKIPGVQLTKSSADKLLPAAQAATLKVSVDPAKTSTLSTTTNALDTLNPSSSRGIHGSNGVVKPDVAAPGTSIASAGVGTGDGAATMSGTSMATPHTAGIAALVAANGNYTPYEVKSIVMNTAAKDIMQGKNAYGPNRVGSGRVMADAALKTPVIAYDKKAADLVSTNFGIVEAVDNNTKITRTIELRNLTTKAVTYDADYVAATSMPGVTISLDKKKVTVPSKGKAEVNVTVTVKRAQLAKTMDPTMQAQQSGILRQYLADATGRVEFTTPSAPTLRVPVTSEPKATSDMSAQASKIAKNDSATLKLKGSSVDSGDGSEQYLSKVGVFTLGAESARQGAALDKVPGGREMDLQYVGAHSTAPAVGLEDGVLNVGVSTWGNWATLGGSDQIEISWDTNGDGKVDFTTYTGRSAGVDLELVQTVNRSGKAVDVRPLNNLFGNVDTNTFDTNVAMLPVSLKALGITDAAGASKLRYSVATWNMYNADANGNLAPVDETDWIAYNPAAPALAVQQDGTSFADLKGLSVPVKVKDSGARALLLHLHNPTGDLSGTKDEDGGKAEVVSFEK